MTIVYPHAYLRRMIALAIVLLTGSGFAVVPHTARAADDPPKAYVLSGTDTFDPAKPIRSVGIFGAFSNGTTVRKREQAGLLTFSVYHGPSATSGDAWAALYWTGLLPTGANADLGRLTFPGTVVQSKPVFMDWTTGRFDYETRLATAPERVLHSRIYMSRTFPALLGETDADTWTWKSLTPALRFTVAAYPDRTGKWHTLSLDSGGKSQTIPGDQMGTPYLILWNRADRNSSMGVVPVLVRLEKRPQAVLLAAGEGDAPAILTVQYKPLQSAGAFAIMPLSGIQRWIGNAASAWNDSVPMEARAQAAFWNRATAAFPIGTAETFQVSDTAGTATIKNSFTYKKLMDAWGTKPLVIAPAPPLTALAQTVGYPVMWADADKGAKVERSPVATFLGPYAFRLGNSITYKIPLLSGRSQVLAPVLTRHGNPATVALQTELDTYVRNNPINEPLNGDGGLGLPVKEFIQAYPILSGTNRKVVAPGLAKTLAATFAKENLQTVIEPTTGQRYVMSNKIWCVGEPYDREWYTGRQLDVAGEYANWVDPSAVRPLYKTLQGMYAYYRLYQDWAWSGTASSVYGFNLTGDGMNFAMEGMLAMGRIAQRNGDNALYQDTCYRSAKQGVNTFASFTIPDWLKSKDAAIWTDTAYDPETKRGRYITRHQPVNEVITDFGMDGYSDESGARMLRPGSFWHATAALFWNNPSLYRLYTEHSLYNTVYRWEYITLPQLHPHWFDNTVTEIYENKPYGGGHAAAHVVARAILFGEPASRLKNYMDKMGETGTFQHTRMLQSILQSNVPQLWLPAAQIRLVSNEWDASTRRLTTKLVGEKEGIAGCDIAWRQWGEPFSIPAHPSPGPRPKTIHINGKIVPVRTVPGGFWRVDLMLKKGAEVTVTTDY